jgi:hypothetical protein
MGSTIYVHFHLNTPSISSTTSQLIVVPYTKREGIPNKSGENAAVKRERERNI